MPRCPKCLGHGVHPKHRVRCALCNGTGVAPKLPSGEYEIAHGQAGSLQDRDTLVPCPVCERCKLCDGKGMVTKEKRYG